MTDFTIPPGGSPAAFGPPDLWLRARRVEDAEALTAMTALPLFRHGTLRPPFPDAAATRRWLEGKSPDDLAIVALLGDKMVGSAELQRHPGRRRHCALLGLGVHDDHQGQGVGKAMLHALVDAADRWLDIKRIELNVFTDNAAAIALYRRFGFVEEGVMRAYAFRDGAYVDSLMMARLRP